MKENLLRKEIEHHIETARSTENKADKIQRELEIIKMKEKAESKVQTRYDCNSVTVILVTSFECCCSTLM